MDHEVKFPLMAHSTFLKNKVHHNSRDVMYEHWDGNPNKTFSSSSSLLLLQSAGQSYPEGWTLKIDDESTGRRAGHALSAKSSHSSCREKSKLVQSEVNRIMSSSWMTPLDHPGQLTNPLRKESKQTNDESLSLSLHLSHSHAVVQQKSLRNLASYQQTNKLYNIFIFFCLSEEKKDRNTLTKGHVKLKHLSLSLCIGKKLLEAVSELSIFIFQLLHDIYDEIQYKARNAPCLLSLTLIINPPRRRIFTFLFISFCCLCLVCVCV